jgi:hypothetical protein
MSSPEFAGINRVSASLRHANECIRRVKMPDWIERGAHPILQRFQKMLLYEHEKNNA